MKQVFLVLQIVVAGALSGIILLQARGTGLEGSWGGTGQLYHSKKGMEKILFLLTIFLAVFFLLLSLINIQIG